MTKPTVKNKANILIKAFLIANKGKKYTAKEISNWINENPFNLSKSFISAQYVGQEIAKYKSQNAHMLYGITVEKRKTGSDLYYWSV